jgi:hypothetical protein
MPRRPLLALVIMALALGGCAGPSTRDDPIGVVGEAEGARPVIDYPFELAPMRQVPTTAAHAFVTRRDDGFLALWVETSPIAGSAVKAIALDGHGVPLAKTPFVVGTAEDGTRASIAGAACAPAGECAVIWGGPHGTLQISTIDADKTLKRRELAVSIDPAMIAYDADASAFVVALNSAELYAFHFAKGKMIDAMPAVVAPGGSTLEGLDCAPGHGCLVTFESNTDPGTTGGAIVDATGAGLPFSIASLRLEHVTYGDGVYFTLARTSLGLGVVRLDLDGVPIDAAPVPLLDPGEGGRQLDGAAFDGEAFTAIGTTRTVDQHGTTHEQTEGGRVLADGSAAMPATFELAGFGAPLALACGDAGACAAIVGHDAAGEPALSALAIEHGAPAPAATALAKTDPGQSIGATLTIGHRVFAVWSEDSLVRGRWFDGEGGPASAVTELGEASAIEAGLANGDAGLFVVVHADGSRATRVVTADGVGPEVPLALPANTRKTAASFAWLDVRPDGSVGMLRFDAEGRALDAKPIELARPAVGLRQASLLARAGDLFVAATCASGEPAASLILQVRGTGEIVGRTRFTAASLGGLACSTSECMVTLRPAETSGAPSRSVLIGRLPVHVEAPPLAESKIATGAPGPVAFDGQHFLASYTSGDTLFVARLDGDVPWTGARQRDGDEPVFFNATARGRALLFSRVSTVTGTPARPELLAHASLVLVEGFGSAASGGATSGGAPVVAEGGGCAIAPHGEASGAALALVTAVALRRRRPRRRASARERRQGG